MNGICMRIFAAAIVALSIVPASAQDNGHGNTNAQEQRGPTGRRQPPPEALSACSGKAQNWACSFEAPRGTVTGTCRTVPSGQTVCVPNNHRRGGRNGNMPPSANSPADR